MVDYKQILRLRAEGVSQRGIADAPGCLRNTVAAMFVAATAFDELQLAICLASPPPAIQHALRSHNATVPRGLAGQFFGQPLAGGAVLDVIPADVISTRRRCPDHPPGPATQTRYSGTDLILRYEVKTSP